MTKHAAELMPAAAKLAILALLAIVRIAQATSQNSVRKITANRSEKEHGNTADVEGAQVPARQPIPQRPPPKDAASSTRTEAYMSAVLSISPPQQQTEPHESVESVRVSTRYKDAYREARFIVGIGTAIKVIGYIIAAIVLFGAWASTTSRTASPLRPMGLEVQDIILAAAILDVILVAHFWVAGTLVCSWGQHLKAGLDCAINSSPFLSNAQRASAMSLD